MRHRARLFFLGGISAAMAAGAVAMAEPNWTALERQCLEKEVARKCAPFLEMQPDHPLAARVTQLLAEGPAAGLTNHIATTPQSHFILIRDTIQDWGRETPCRLEVARLDGPPPAPPPGEAALARQAADLARQIAPRVHEARDGGVGAIAGFFQGPANQLSAPKIREGGRWGLSASGHFLLADDEALVVTLDPIGAQYLAVQLANGWLGSLDYIHHTASLNLAQTRHNADRTVTLVIAPADPGVANWLDTTGLHQGSIFVRWQKLPTPLSANAAGVREVRLVKLKDLPATLARVSPEARRAELAARAAAYGRRFAE